MKHSWNNFDVRDVRMICAFNKVTLMSDDKYNTSIYFRHEIISNNCKSPSDDKKNSTYRTKCILYPYFHDCCLSSSTHRQSSIFSPFYTQLSLWESPRCRAGYKYISLKVLLDKSCGGFFYRWSTLCGKVWYATAVKFDYH